LGDFIHSCGPSGARGRVDLISEPLLFLSSMEKENLLGVQTEVTCLMCEWSGPLPGVSEDNVARLADFMCPGCSASLFMVVEEDEAVLSLEQRAEALVRERIPGMRKGTTDKPAYTHSFHVRDLLEEHGYGPEVCLAGLLHDIVEDGDVPLEELRAAGFSERVVGLVDLCSHDASIEGTDARWVVMIARLVQADDSDAWAIKVADLADNLRDSGTMEVERREWMVNVKRPIMRRMAKEVSNGLIHHLSSID
jgi:hypothetical protein